MKWSNRYRIRLIFVGIVAALVLGGGNVKADFTWTRKADMPTPRWTHTSAVVNGKIYVVGGRTSQPDEKALSTIEEYDPVTNTWTKKADMLSIRCDMIGSSAVVDGKIYVIGGYNGGSSWGSSTVEEYDPVTDTWTQKADMPTPRWSLATCAVDGKIYAIGGAPDSITGLNIVEQYDPTNDTWMRKASMPVGLWGLCARVVNGKIYTLGGRPGYIATANVNEYDPATNIWTRKADMPVGTSQMASVVFDDKIIVIGGWSSSGNHPYQTVQIYEPETDTWSIEADAPFLRATVAGEVVNDKIYVIGGTDRPHPCPATSTVYEFGPLLDFNGDGTVGIEELEILIESWAMDDPLCDIAPPPFGDGIVDVQDLEVFMNSWGQAVDDPTLIGHYKLDEAEGSIASDSARQNDGTLSGEPLWQPDGGMVGGALLFDGIDDYVNTDPVLNPADGVFSVVAWVMGGVQGQIVLSQAGRANWLCTDSLEGCLVTELEGSGRPSSGPLLSEAKITDGTWHRIGLVWDGSYRHLYVDGAEVAKDAAPLSSLEDAYGGLYFGAGSTLTPDSFFSGLIDDIRVYNRAVRP